MANKVLGMHRLKNKVNRNAFDLSHRHMFTAQIGELLPVFSQWVNPNETFKIGYNGKTRTAALKTDAFTRIRENIQYYFVPFQSLWKYFEQQVNNMSKGDAGQRRTHINTLQIITKSTFTIFKKETSGSIFAIMTKRESCVTRNYRSGRLIPILSTWKY